MSPIVSSTISLRKVVFAFGITCLLLLLIGYGLFQARFILTGPVIAMTSSPDQTQTQRVITLTGNAQNITSLSLNGREIYTDKDGYFDEDVVLENGYTVTTLTARDRYGRIKVYEHNFVYTPSIQLSKN